MSIPLYFPPTKYLSRLTVRRPIPLRKLCELAGVKCRATGPWIERPIELVVGESLKISAEPGDWSPVQIETGPGSLRQRARIALAALAYGMQDQVAKQSIIGQKWSRVTPPQGRPKSGCAMTGAERQRRFRKRHHQR